MASLNIWFLRKTKASSLQNGYWFYFFYIITLFLNFFFCLVRIFQCFFHYIICLPILLIALTILLSYLSESSHNLLDITNLNNLFLASVSLPYIILPECSQYPNSTFTAKAGISGKLLGIQNIITVEFVNAPLSHIARST